MTIRGGHHLFTHLQRKQNVLVRLTSSGDDGIRAATEEMTGWRGLKPDPGLTPVT